jgi:ribosomal protein S18 acetylase RimI-like enzyme
MLEIKDATCVHGNVARRISEIFVDGFGKDLQLFSKQKEVLVNALEHMFTLEVFSVALQGEKIIGIGACTNGSRYSVYPKMNALIKHLGLIKGMFAYWILKHEFHKPLKRIGPKIASVEFIATDSNYRGKGVASALIHSFIAKPDYDEFILEVADTNVNAVKLYAR